MSQEPVQLVWFKRDLRASDHAPLLEAAQRGPVLPLYIIEPSLLQAPDHDPRHFSFVRESLAELREALAALGQPLVVRVGEALEVFDALRQTQPIAAVWAHQETGNALSYARDRSVRRYWRSLGVPLHELPSGGVVRRLRSRDEWLEHWERRMGQAPYPLPQRLLPVGIEPGPLPTHAGLGLPADRRCERQSGGSAAGLALLEGFLSGRARGYLRSISSPNTAWEGCARLSAHLAWGTLSLRQVVQATRARLGRADPGLRRDLEGFLSRLYWRDHFIQKLEDQPDLEERNLLRSADGLREAEFKPEHFAAWCEGRTGYPMVDAAMRALRATGWLNFRLRAMLVSFAAYHLWLHWREPALHLARCFADYEPGIHYCQMQMQSGTTGINTLRVYNPTKQAAELDPQGHFIRRWLPELAHLPTAYLHKPWEVPPLEQLHLGFEPGRDYPLPIVSHEASRRALQRLHAVRQSPEAQREMAAILHKHGSRKRHSPPQNATSHTE